MCRLNLAHSWPTSNISNKKKQTKNKKRKEGINDATIIMNFKASSEMLISFKYPKNTVAPMGVYDS